MITGRSSSTSYGWTRFILNRQQEVIVDLLLVTVSLLLNASNQEPPLLRFSDGEGSHTNFCITKTPIP
jgi:hypothetical protein